MADEPVEHAVVERGTSVGPVGDGRQAEESGDKDERRADGSGRVVSRCHASTISGEADKTLRAGVQRGFYQRSLIDALSPFGLRSGSPKRSFARGEQMYQPDKPRHRVKMLAAVAGLGAMAVMGVITAIDATPATVGGTTDQVAMKLGATITMTTPPTAPETSFAAPTVKATPK
jgi:hypothetical protein